MWTFKFEIELDIRGFASRGNAHTKAIELVNMIADLMTAVGVRMRAKIID
jgi:hypothetical protein